ncbi:hypothetical protein M8R20_46120 [Pseudomonas sp. R2.Fl]|nr:hypothetical protein [Pseudomonas sp. R2.Fl]MCL6714368.1 hypothetical protein [Pseudomonas sp. R2.Fl]
MTPTDSQAARLHDEPPRFVVLKASGSRFAYVNDTLKGVTVKRYDILKGDGKRNGWNMAKRHADDLNAAHKAKETPNG